MENELELVELSYKDIEEQLSQNEYEIIPIYDNRIESMSLPLFAQAFWCYVTYNNKIPSLKEFIDYYLEVNSDKTKIKRLDSIQTSGLHGRLSRSYPSLTRDIHFAKLLDDKLDLDILYNLKLDIEKGIDVLIDGRYGFHLFYDSKRSNNFRKKKITRHDDLDEIIEFDLPFNEKWGKKIGNVFLYDDWYVIKALELIIKER